MHIRTGSGCPECGEGEARRLAIRRLKPEQYHELAQIRGFLWRGETVPPNNNTPTLWQCSRGHQWRTSYGSLHGCPKCYEKTRGQSRRLKRADFEALAQAHAIEWLGTEPVTAKVKTGWRCTEGHEWQATYDGIQSKGRGCPVCGVIAAGLKRRLTADDFHALAQQRGFQWLGTDPVGNAIKTEWECSRGHRWFAHYNNVLQGKGCPECAVDSRASKRRLKPEDYHQLARSKQLEWIGVEVPQDQSIHTEWCCANGHKYSASYASVATKTKEGCPQCLDMVNGALVSSQQRALHAMLGGELNYPVERYRLDIAFPDEQVVVEYDCWYWHQKAVERDAKRDAYLLSIGWKIVRVRAGELLPTERQLQEALSRLLNGESYVEIILEDWGG